MTPPQIPVAEGIFRETQYGPRLVGSRCPGCGSLSFPQADHCRDHRCGSPAELALLGPRGVIWSHTVLHYPPPPPFTMTEIPYSVAQVDLAEGIRVSGMLTPAAAAQARIGLDVELVLDPIRTDESGTEVLTWKFAPVGRPEGGAR